jgi:general secretion pathway protein I
MADRPHPHGPVGSEVTYAEPKLMRTIRGPLAPTRGEGRGEGAQASNRPKHLRSKRRSKQPASLRLAGSLRNQRGFTLLEVLVAFAILALTLGALIQVFSQAIAATILSGAYSRASVLAEQKLDDVGLDIPLQAGSFSGEPEDGIAWQVTIAPYDLGDTGWQAPLQPYVVTATAAWEDGGRQRRITLSSMRLGEPIDAGTSIPAPNGQQGP